ncbi:MAG: hypothetical protein LBI45_02350 [Bacteroidales bacterium]|jgi:hypothetical protein|nr:hypothetical protein [Bacteroidales bacterium]
MKKFALIILLILFCTNIFPQINILGFFERKWSSHSTLEFYTDFTFEENYLWFLCGMYEDAMPDKKLKGIWEIDGDTLTMRYYDNKNESSLNVYKYLLYDNGNLLIPFLFLDYPYMYYYKTKEYDSQGLVKNTTVLKEKRLKKWLKAKAKEVKSLL